MIKVEFDASLGFNIWWFSTEFFTSKKKKSKSLCIKDIQVKREKASKGKYQ